MSFKFRTASVNGRRGNILGAWIQAFRIHFVATSVLPAVLGSVIAWSRFQEFHFWNFALVIVGVTVNHLGLNMIDDVFDYYHAVDTSHGDDKNPYSGGSGILTDGTLPAAYLLAAAVFCFFVTVVIALYLTIVAGWLVLIFSLVGILSSIFYAAPPVRFGYRGLGELGLLVNFGPVICLGAFYVQTGSLSMEPFVISLVLGCMMWSMIIINEMPDYEEDRRAGKWNLVARFGRKTGAVLYGAGLIGAYLAMVLPVLFGMAPFAVLLGLFTVPVAYGSFGVLMRNYSDRLKMIPANRAMLKIHTITGMLLIIAYLLAGTFR